MSAQDFLAAALSASIAPLSGGDTIVIGSTTIPAILDPIQEVEDLMLGGDGDHRSVTCLVHSADLPPETPKKGDAVQLRGQDWHINSIDHHPATTTRMTLHSPSRRN